MYIVLSNCKNGFGIYEASIFLIDMEGWKYMLQYLPLVSYRITILCICCLKVVNQTGIILLFTCTYSCTIRCLYIVCKTSYFMLHRAKYKDYINNYSYTHKYTYWYIVCKTTIISGVRKVALFTRKTRK